MEISGPVNLCFSKFNTIDLYLFSDIHMPIDMGRCNSENAMDMTDFCKKFFKEYQDKSIHFYLENRIYLPGDNLFENHDNGLMIPKISTTFDTCFNHCSRTECQFPHVVFENIDFRYGHKENNVIQRTLFSLFEKCNVFISQHFDDPTIMKKYSQILSTFKTEYWKILSYYLCNTTDYNSLNLANLTSLTSIPYEEITLNSVSPIYTQLENLSFDIQQKILNFAEKIIQ